MAPHRSLGAPQAPDPRALAPWAQGITAPGRSQLHPAPQTPPQLPMRHLHLIALTAPLALAACGAPSASITPFIASVGIDGDLGVGDGAGTSVASSFNDLGLDDNEAVVGGLGLLELQGGVRGRVADAGDLLLQQVRLVEVLILSLLVVLHYYYYYYYYY